MGTVAMHHHTYIVHYSRVGGGFPLPTITHAPSLVTSSMVRNTVPGPGGKTRPLGGVVNVSDFRSREIVASRKTRRALEWNAWLEKPRSMSETVASGQYVAQYA